jgi:hypothetical protein
MKQSLPKKLARGFFILALLVISLTSYTNSGGPPAGNTGAPSETACGGCHGAATTSGTNWNAITLTGVTGNNYAAGQTYTITVSGNAAGTAKNGFQITALNSSNAAAGTFTAGTGNTASSSGGRNYITHNSTGNSQSSWSFQWTAPNPAVGNVTFYLAYNATNANSQTSGDIVYAKTFVMTSGPAAPVATITAPANASTFCVGDTVQFTGTATNSPTSFAWDFLGNTPNSSTQQNPKIVLGPNVGSRTIRFRATNAGGTSPNAQIVINVVAKPTATITASSTSICGNDSVTLTANAGNGFTYFWSPGGQTTQSIKTATPGNYTVRVTNPGNCSVTSAVTTLTGGGAKPQVSLILSKDTICSTDSVLLTASSGMDYYKFSVNGNVIDSSTSNTKWMKGFTNSPLILGVKGYVGICASDAAERLLQISQKPQAPIINCGPFTSSSVTFDIMANNAEVSLDSGKTWNAANQGRTHFITGLLPNTQVNLLARYPVSGPCLYSNVSSKTCAAASCPPISLQIEAPKYVCANTINGMMPKTKIKVSTSNMLNPHFKYTANHNMIYMPFGYGKSDSVEFIYPDLSAPSSITILISVLDSANAFCPSKDTSVTIFYREKPNVNITTNKQFYCQGDSITLRVNTGSLSAAYKEVSFYRDSIFIGSNTRQNNYQIGPLAVHPAFPDGSKVYAMYTDTVANCAFRSNEHLMFVKPSPIVGFTSSTFNLNIVLNDTSSQTDIRTWYLEGDSFTVSNRVYNYTFKNAGNNLVRMKGFNSFPCASETQRTINITASGLVEQNDAFGLSMYPNPASDIVYVNWEKGDVQLQATLMDVNGRKVIDSIIKKGESLNLNNLASGVYVLQLSDGKQISQRKLQIQ